MLTNDSDVQNSFPPTSGLTLSSDSEASPLPFDLFSSITIHGVTDSVDGHPVPFTMKRDISFPHQLMHRIQTTEKVWEHSMQPHPVPVDGLHLTLELGDLIGYGASAHVYAVHIISIDSKRDEEGSSFCPSFQLPELCIKLAEPNRVRGLAREAWFYEQLHVEGLEGVISPRFYGFYTSSCDHTRVVPWRTKEWNFRKYPHLFEHKDGFIPKDHIGNDPKKGPGGRWFDDQFGSHQNSKWIDYRQRCDSPLLSILLLERLGDTLQRYCKIQERSFYHDVKDVLEDAVWKGFFHDDVRYNQFALAPDPIPCPRHGRPHNVYLLDFEMVHRIPAITGDRRIAHWEQAHRKWLHADLEESDPLDEGEVHMSGVDLSGR
ncbi:hypothetical protein QCA50_010908 [Cerrena zonata]|uniref:Aminoglycoside phosphotransferase domain-containing protein n=1 Tax=Cerrena zonata TaxID=2478898 RepID=A0AAW0FZB4_9APHY